jgi:hypothetical protein
MRNTPIVNMCSCAVSQSVRGVAAQETKGLGASREFLDGRQGYDFV